MEREKGEGRGERRESKEKVGEEAKEKSQEALGGVF